DQAEHDAFQHEDHGLVDGVQVQPGLRGRDLGAPGTDRQPGDDHRRHPGDMNRLAGQIRGIGGDQGRHRLQHGAVIRPRTTVRAAAPCLPAGAPRPASVTNSPAPCSRAPVAAIPAAPPSASETAIWNSTRLVPSLNRLSACTSAWSRAGMEMRRASALTATGSVLARTAPSTKAILAERDTTAPEAAATAAADASTSPTARATTGRHTARKSRHDSSSLAAYNSGGRTTRLTTAGGT